MSAISPFLSLLAVGTSALILFYSLLRRRDQLKDFRGPWIAKRTNFWRLYNVWNCRPFETLINLHRNYGSAVRIGPNVISLSNPALIKVVYQTRNAWRKVSERQVAVELIGTRLTVVAE